MDEYVFPTVRQSDEAVAPSALNHFTDWYPRPMCLKIARSMSRPGKLRRRDPFGVAVLASTLSTSVTCGPLWPMTNPNLDRIARLHGADPALSQHAPMKEGVARPIGEFNEPKAFLGIEPLDDTTDRWTGGCLDGSSTVSGFDHARSASSTAVNSKRPQNANRIRLSGRRLANLTPAEIAAMPPIASGNPTSQSTSPAPA